MKGRSGALDRDYAAGKRDAASLSGADGGTAGLYLAASLRHAITNQAGRRVKEPG